MSGLLHAFKYYMNECEVKPSPEILKRAVVLVEKASNQNFLDLIELFKLTEDFSNEYMVTRAKDALVK